MEKIEAKRVMYIKLGSGGVFINEPYKCLENGKMMLDFSRINHDDCTNGDWDAVRSNLTKDGRSTRTATNDLSELKNFYFDDDKTLWITFHANKVWWCFCEPKVTLNSDNTKFRNTINGWKDSDITGNRMFFNRISGRILKTQGYRKTICSFDNIESSYIVNKINHEKASVILCTEKYLGELEKSLYPLIEFLWWPDFEILIDMIFRHGGWQRVSELGGEQKTIDLDLIMPISNLRAAVQVKSQSNRKTFDDWASKSELEFKEYQELYYFVHTLKGKFESNYTNSYKSKVKLYCIEDIAKLVISAGLVDWLIDKTS